MNRFTRPDMIGKYAGVAILFGIYALVSAWLVASEGEAYRQSIARQSAEIPPTTTASQTTAVLETSTKNREAEPPSPVAVLKKNDSKPKLEPLREPAKQPSASQPEGVKPVGRSPDTLTASTSTHPTIPLDPFWEEPSQKKVWDLEHLTLEDERELGLALNRTIRRYHKPLDTGPLPRRLEDAAEPYLKTVARKDLKYTFTVLDCPRMNVFSTPGGYIYVCKGLFDWIAEDEDYALGFALAHEMAHVDLGHAVICLRDPEVKKLNLTTVPLFFLVAIPGGYLEAQDYEADRWAVERMLKLGRTRYESLAFLRRLEDYAKSHDFENDPPKKPNDEPKVPWLDNHIRAHPIPRKRLKELKVVIDRLLKI